jgi:ABC-type lipoprotein release transport system permease subunit
LLTAVVYHVSPSDPFVLAGAAIAMVMVGLGAAWVPARRAIAVNAADTLRSA